MKFSPEDLVTQTTAAKMRGVSLQAILNLVKRGRLTAVIIDGHTFVLRREVERFETKPAGRPKRKGTRKRSG